MAFNKNHHFSSLLMESINCLLADKTSMVIYVNKVMALFVLFFFFDNTGHKLAHLGTGNVLQKPTLLISQLVDQSQVMNFAVTRC